MGEDQVHHGARAQRTSRTFPDSFSHLIIMAASLSSSSTCSQGSRWGGEERWWFVTQCAAEKIGKKSYLGMSRTADLIGAVFARDELFVSRKLASKLLSDG